MSSRNWQHAVQASVQANRYVPLPDEVCGVVQRDHPLDGPSVCWNYDRNSHYVVLSQRPLVEPGYVDVGRYKIYGSDGEERGRVRPPDGLDEVVRSKFTEGSRVMYLAYEEMTGGENGMVYLLSTGQLLELLPEDTSGDPPARGSDLQEAVLGMPGILPSP